MRSMKNSGTFEGHGYFPEDGQIIISRKITGSRSICKINGETCTVSVVKEAASYLLDIHGQHEHQSLLYPEKQMDILDAYGREDIWPVREKTAKLYREYADMKKELSTYQLDEEQRKREMDFLAFEIGEIEDAQLKEGEDEALETEYRRLINGKKITEALDEIYEQTDMRGMEAQTGLEELCGALPRLRNLTKIFPGCTLH